LHVFARLNRNVVDFVVASQLTRNELGLRVGLRKIHCTRILAVICIAVTAAIPTSIVHTDVDTCYTTALKALSFIFANV
jgi:hypothetical protein